ncbi:cupin domain-containing protein [Devosia sediminis]|uniref:cupin domain-containing protein n=1 Tax=Devosia sediminis TaxID=2798801 RepID=UPI0038B34F15
MGKLVDRAQWSGASDDAGVWRGEIEGRHLGANVSVIFVHTDKPGGGPRLHRHPYAETFIIRKGRALFTVGEDRFEASAGQIITCPANVAHKFENLGPGTLEQIDIHEASQFSTEWLE